MDATSILTEGDGEQLYQKAQNARRDDLIVYFALGLFSKRQAYKHMPESLKRDIKAFFQSHSKAIDEATNALFSVGNPDLIENSAISAHQVFQHGEFNDGHSWIVHKNLLQDLPSALRIYVGCAAQLYGDLSNIDLIKIHFTSGKVSFMRYDDWNKSTPLLIERIKVKLRDQDVDFFEYGGHFESSPLTNKAQFGAILPRYRCV